MAQGGRRQPHRPLSAADRHAAAAQGALLRGDVAAAHRAGRDHLPPPTSSRSPNRPGMMPKIDNMLVFRCVQVVRRLQLKSRDVGLFCKHQRHDADRQRAISAQFLDFMRANRALAAVLMFEFTQTALSRLRPAASMKVLAALAERGFRFAMDHVTDLRLDAEGMSDRSFRFLKVPAKLLLNRRHRSQKRYSRRGSRRPDGALWYRS